LKNRWRSIMRLSAKRFFRQGKQLPKKNAAVTK
jgi:hypothetical protein